MFAQKWLPCKLSPGQFSEEFAVSALDHKGIEFSLFAHGSFVEHDCPEVSDGVECNGRLLVTLLDQLADLALIRLPGRTFENGSTVTVRASQLEAGAASHA